MRAKQGEQSTSGVVALTAVAHPDRRLDIATLAVGVGVGATPSGLL